ncbi:hypothetical protein H5410_034534 [Solanum commersonii]|uniref:Uncharacterized protein n=1 Tax=Solanum commersonii TaxID=4109 RepID=A0A9J5YVS3_SOLCO|nr:hypothetical protein H5410_034534 [Solanum commersonii]
MEIGAGYRGMIYFCNGFAEYYRIDLNCLPERLSSIANFTTEKSVGWTVIDECIGGMKGEYNPFTVGMNLNKFTPTTNSNSTWELILHAVMGTHAFLLLLESMLEEKWIHLEELHHPNMILTGSDLFEQCAGGETLFYIVKNIKAVVCDSTLYWFNNDLCLYGYDYVQKRWFQLNSLEGELTWQLFLDPKYLVYIPLLVYLDNETFVAICRVINEELGMAIIGVTRDSLSLNVSLKFSRNFPVDTSAQDGVNPYSGMAM